MAQLAQLIHELISNLSDSVKTAGDAVSVSVALTSVIGWLPALAALASLVWTVLRVVEWFEQRKHRKLIEQIEMQQIQAGKLVITEKNGD